ncbi:MAG: DUF4384 domain-containing protein [Candidatus Eisenbacteria bacterium]|nr:DUF4384 domain-containing protein [Candidatus Eisenbacteria bacterium]
MKLKMSMLLASVLAVVSMTSSSLAIQPAGSHDERGGESETYMERESYRQSPLVIDVWTDRGEGGVYYAGERIRVFFRASRDCYVTIYNVDTQGYVHLLYPAGSFDEHFAAAGVTYRVPSRRSPYDLVIDGPTGIEYVEAVASVEPFRARPPWYLDPEYGEWQDSPWSLYGSDYEDHAEDYDYYVERGIVRGDPFLAIQSINRQMIPADYPSSYYATTYTSFYVDRRVQYPRYLCYDCHQGHSGFDPYRAGCVVFDIRVDRTWVYSPRIVLRDYRPKYYYGLRETAPVRYKGERHFWSSKDGLMTLRRQFSISKPKFESGTAGSAPRAEERWKELPGPSALKKWKAGKEPSVSGKTVELKKRLESEGLSRPKQVEEKQKEYQQSRGTKQVQKQVQKQGQKQEQGQRQEQEQKQKQRQEQEQGQSKKRK